MLLDEAIEWTRDTIKTNVTQGLLGTGGTVAQTSDTGLEYPDSNTTSATTNATSGNLITFSFTKNSAVGAGTTYKEYGLKDTGNTVDWTRYVFTALQATSYEDWNIKVRMFIRRV